MRLAHALIALLITVLALATSATELYVSPTGDDAGAGTQDKPLRTFAATQKAVRAARTTEKPITVYFRGGTYYLPETVVLTDEDSGTKMSPVLYTNTPGEEAVISGGAKLDLKWEPYKDGIMQAKVPAGTTFDQLFINGERQHMARYPNFDPNVRHFNGSAADAISPQRVARWADPTGGYIHAMHAAEWGGMHYRITGKSADGALQYEGGWQNNRPSGMHKTHRMVENIFEELDAPGEWFLNEKTATLYFYPPAGLDIGKAIVEVVRLRHLIELRGDEKSPVRFVNIKGLTFRHAARTFMDNKEPMVRSDWTTYRGGAIFYNGTEDCTLEDCFVDQVGGNAVFVNNYNRRVTVRGCHIARAGGNGVAFFGDRNAARVPRDWKDTSQSLATLDRTPGPKSSNYPADCLVDDCLIYLSGRVEKQTAPVQIELSQGITVRHCSLYDVPRAGINIGDGCWGGHVIEFCDIFDTVKETGDHGSFNSWGRDRFWSLRGLDLNDDKTWEAEKAVPVLDAVKTVVMHNNRWRCDHGWDIDLDDGSTNYHLYNNLCLNGGIKNREGFFRIVENNIMVNNGFHPHVWYKHSEDIVRKNIVCSDHYLPAGGMPATAWGKEMDNNLVHRDGVKDPQPAEKMAKQSKQDEHSIVADAQFVDAVAGDFRVKEGSPALQLGFVNFPMDQFGVISPKLKAIARTPEIPPLKGAVAEPERTATKRPSYLFQAQVRDISGLGDRSAYGLPGEYGVLMLSEPASSPAAKAGLQKDDVIVACDGKETKTIADVQQRLDTAAGKKVTVSISRKQGPLTIEMSDYAYVVTESQATPEFKIIPLAPASAVLPATITAAAKTGNEPLAVLIDGKLAKNFGPVYGNGVQNGLYKLDLGASKAIAQINTFSYNQGGNRGRQHFVLYASNADADPGWKVEDPRLFAPLIDVDTRKAAEAYFTATSIRQSGGKPLGIYRWLVWAVAPVTTNSGGENTAFQEFQVIPAP